MKINKILLSFLMLFLFACSNDEKIDNKIQVESVSVQELNDEVYFKTLDTKVDKKITEKYKLTNNNYALVKKDSVSECSDPENIILENYV
ncbi:hypothetical protein LJB88_03435, partial [Erysipelotrichaceae bacterium OttesenSCG-928-M19]|nr:hypothetical protein [Erysipelotrichaceae bacterium OttesenSCG-928-M19]